jgi:hypothetical protein
MISDWIKLSKSLILWVMTACGGSGGALSFRFLLIRVAANGQERTATTANYSMERLMLCLPMSP